ncbi:MAG: VCBS repeat-containing protein, partial [Bacteroidota bacterium]
MKKLFVLSFSIIIILFSNCKSDGVDTTNAASSDNEITAINPGDFETNFSLLPPKETGIIMKNTLSETLKDNFITYPYIFNGGGLAIGDINNDGLDDIYIGSNQKSNKLYLNKGNFKFEDITRKAGVEDAQGWTSGITMVDINNDGYLDIYVCKSASVASPALRKNKLFVNNKNNTFTEAADQYGIADNGYASQAYFFDADQDQDLDLYLVNHRVDFTNNAKINSEIQRDIRKETSDQFFINNGNGTFSEIGQLAGVHQTDWSWSALFA